MQGTESRYESATLDGRYTSLWSECDDPCGSKTGAAIWAHRDIHAKSRMVSKHKVYREAILGYPRASWSASVCEEDSSIEDKLS